jgi:hypothetical protein
MARLKKFLSITNLILNGCLFVCLTTTSVWQPLSGTEKVRQFTRPYEFDFSGWTVDAFWQKLSALSLGPIRHLNNSQERKIIRDYFNVLDETKNTRRTLEDLYSDPDKTQEEGEASALETRLFEKEHRLKQISLLAEAVIQDQVSQTLGAAGLTDFSQPLPPVFFHVTDLPKNLILSPRNVIKQEKSISLVSGLSPGIEISLENSVEENTDFSALVVPVGGIGTYPTMVISTGNLLYLTETISHEWIHNYLSLRPLGWNYAKNPALRTMNETAASIAGEELSWLFVRRFYSDLIAPEEDFSYKTIQADYHFQEPQTPDSFNFQQEMYQTRLIVDGLLADGKVEEAENFMEERRKIFWDNGFQIRKLNQAYFAFYGAYADKPYSAAGADPVGASVRLLRAKSKDLTTFIKKISRMDSYEELLESVHIY